MSDQSLRDALDDLRAWCEMQREAAGLEETEFAAGEFLAYKRVIVHLRKLLAAHPAQSDSGTVRDRAPSHNATHPVGRRDVPGVHHADDCPMRHGFITTGCFCGREGEREAPAGGGT